jgi:hypothetical protein
LSRLIVRLQENKRQIFENTMAPSLDGAEDRLNEAHFFLHAMEGSYHQAEPLRFHLNAFLRAIKEVPQLIQMGVQAAPELVAWLRPEIAALRQDPLINYLFEKRDFIVHRDRLLPSSTAFIGITEGRGLKWGISMQLDPTKDSDVLMQAYIITVKANGDVFQLLSDDEGSSPCIKREWVLDDLPGREIISVAADAWARVGALLQAVRERVDLPAIDLSLGCRHSDQRIQFRIYNRDTLRQWLSEVPSPEA